MTETEQVFLPVSSQPDILEVISDLSNDEVFTPPKVANAVLDLLPAEVWSDPTLRWLDPGTKTGVFLREITKRLMAGLEDQYPDEDERLDHILRNMVFGIAITELTALMARRTLYCSKDAAGEHAPVRMPTSAGNVWMERVEHSYLKGRCSECGASEDQMEKDNRENYAYAFIHKAGRAAVKEEFEMKFDVIVGNPPYQMDSDGSNRTLPLYHHFVEQAKALKPTYIAMIIPSRWMATGLGLSEFRRATLADRRMTHLVDYPNANELFPGVEIKGGVCYFLWDREADGECSVTQIRGEVHSGPSSRRLDEFDVLVRDARGLEILRKVLSKDEQSITEILSADKEFGMTSNFTGFRTVKSSGDVALHYNRKGKRLTGWMSRSEVPKSSEYCGYWKVLTPKAGSDGGQRLPDVVLGTPMTVEPNSVCTQTYLFFYVDTEEQARSIESYLRTRFFRFLVSQRKISQDATRSTYTWVPQQTWDRTWTDADLYKKYGITTDEQDYIAEMVKEMSA